MAVFPRTCPRRDAVTGVTGGRRDGGSAQDAAYRWFTHGGRLVNDGGMKGRVKGLLGTPPPGDESAEPQPDAPSQPAGQQQALQVLTLAQRTAEEHVANAQRQADKICSD